MNRSAELYCRDMLRDARAAAFRDSEGFAEVLFAVERLGSLKTGRLGTLRDYKQALVSLASQSPLAESLPASRPDLHVSFSRLYGIVQTARNEALHQGASARRLTDHCIELALVLEDALAKESTILGDYMVRRPYARIHGSRSALYASRCSPTRFRSCRFDAKTVAGS